MTLNKFCPVAQGEYYNIKSQTESQLFFPFFPKFFLLFVQLQHIAVRNRFAYNICNSVFKPSFEQFQIALLHYKNRDCSLTFSPAAIPIIKLSCPFYI